MAHINYQGQQGGVPTDPNIRTIDMKSENDASLKNFNVLTYSYFCLVSWVEKFTFRGPAYKKMIERIEWN